MNDVIDRKDQRTDAVENTALFDTALALLTAWIEILQAEIRSQCSARRPLGKQIHPLTRKLSEAINTGRKLRLNDHAAIAATIAFYKPLIEAHRKEDSHAA